MFSLRNKKSLSYPQYPFLYGALKKSWQEAKMDRLVCILCIYKETSLLLDHEFIS